MNPNDPVLLRQRPMLEKIIADETWLEAERRGRPVEPSDPVVRHHVCTVVLRIGADLRERALRELAAQTAARMGDVEISREVAA